MNTTNKRSGTQDLSGGTCKRQDQSASPKKKTAAATKKKADALPIFYVPLPNPPQVTDLVQLRAHRGDIREELQSIVNKLTRQVMADWHDGWYDQGRTAGEWFLALKDPLQEVLTVGVGKKKHLEHCHEVLMILVQSWNDIKEVNSRIDVSTMLNESCDGLSFNIDVPWSETSMKITTMRYGSQPKDLFAYIWNALLRTHASLNDTNEGLLLQCIKDAHENNGDDTTFDGPLCDSWDHTDDDPPDDPGAPDGTALARIMKEKEPEWKSI